MLKRLIKLIVCLTMFSFPETNRKSSLWKDETPSKEEEVSAPTSTPPVTRLALDASFEGTLKCDGDAEIRGTFKGELDCKGHLLLCTNFQGDLSCGSIVVLGSTIIGNVHTDTLITLDQESTIVGDTQSDKLVCAGKIRGNLNIKESLTLTAQSDVEGDIIAGSITMNEGAFFQGNIKMNAQ